MSTVAVAVDLCYHFPEVREKGHWASASRAVLQRRWGVGIRTSCVDLWWLPVPGRLHPHRDAEECRTLFNSCPLRYGHVLQVAASHLCKGKDLQKRKPVLSKGMDDLEVQFKYILKYILSNVVHALLKDASMCF